PLEKSIKTAAIAVPAFTFFPIAAASISQIADIRLEGSDARSADSRVQQAAGRQRHVAYSLGRQSQSRLPRQQLILRIPFGQLGPRGGLLTVCRRGYDLSNDLL